MLKDTFAKGITAIFSAWVELKKPERDTIALWFEWLNEIPDDIFMQSCQKICMNTGFKPQNIPGEIFKAAKELSGELTPEQAYAIIDDYFKKYYSPDFNMLTGNIIRERLGKEYPNLLPLAEKWGIEIAGGSNPTATRAQFIKNYEHEVKLIENKTKQLNSGELKKLDFGGTK